MLEPEERRRGLKMTVSACLSAALDFIGLAALMPVLYFLLEGGQTRHTALLFCLAAFLIISLKSVAIILLTRYQNKCLMSFYKRLSLSLFSSYYRKGLLFIREQGSSKLGYEINVMCYAFTNSLLASLYRMFGEILLILFITIALLVINGTSVFLLYVSFLPFMLVYFFGIRKRVREFGNDDMAAKRRQSRIVLDTFRGFPELEVYGASGAVRNSFIDGIDIISRNRIRLDTILRLPLLLSELSVAAGLSLLVAFGEGDIRILLGTFTVAAFRILPALRTILAGWTQIQNSACCLDTIEEGLRDSLPDVSVDSEPISFRHSIDVNNLTYSYPDGVCILKNFSCSVTKGEYVGIKGPSGVGKSTFFNLLIGLISPASGKILIDGTPLSDSTRLSWMKLIGYVPQDVFIFKGTLAENIALGDKEINYARISEILRKVGLRKLECSLPEGVRTVMDEAGTKLSGGERQRIGIARALYKNAEVLFLDEATSALDDDTERGINHTLLDLRQSYRGLTILSIAHRESSLQYCDRLITIKNPNV